MLISAVKFTSVHLWLLALLRFGSAQAVLNYAQAEKVHDAFFGFSLQTPTAIPAATEGPAYIRNRRASSFCLTPQQPANGGYKLGKYSCEDNNANCSVSEGTALEPGTHLVFTCNPGYVVDGNKDIFCGSKGKWTPVPSCVEVKCDSLNSASTTVTCNLFGDWIHCDPSVPPETSAVVACRPGYKKHTDFLSTRSGAVKCNIDGKWEPNPIECVPACGRTIPHLTPLAIGAIPANISDFPWHASLYVEKNLRTGRSKDFICGGTIIQTNLVLTAAHCVYDERTETITDPAKLFVMTGNIFRDYDSTVHDLEIVRKAAVRTVYTQSSYYGLKGNYASDIALLELQQPFQFSDILSPACLDNSGYSNQFLEPGAVGKVAGFGRTATSSSSTVLQTLTLPYISYSQCKNSSHAGENQAFIGIDKFCAGYTNGSAVCQGDSGGGLVFKRENLWYVMGIVSVSLGVDTYSGESTCAKDSYSLYTMVSIYMEWIQSVLLRLESKQPFPPRSPYTGPSVSPAPPSSRMPISSCLAPPRPNNGNRKLHPDSCETGRDCNIPEGTPLEAGSQLVYSCVGEFTLNGSTDVHCRRGGSWTAIPTCNGEPGDVKGAIARQKCAEYANAMAFDKCPQSITDNGKSIFSLNEISKVPASSMEFPHMAAVGYNSSDGTIIWDCGGALISESFVLTLARCALQSSRSKKNVTWVRVGDLNLGRSGDGAMPVLRRVIEKIRHSDYKKNQNYKDIGLLRLETPIRFNSWIRPACLHTSLSVETNEVIATAWGSPQWSDTSPAPLMKVLLPLVNSPTCNMSYPREPRPKNGVTEQQFICAGAEGRDICRGGWGNPLVMPSRTEQCMYEVVGIARYSPDLCGGLLPGVFVRLHHYLPWIEQTVWGQTLDNPE